MIVKENEKKGSDKEKDLKKKYFIIRLIAKKAEK